MEHLHPIIQSNELVSQNYYQMVFDWPLHIAPPEPGQFMTLRTSQQIVPLLRRPFAFSGFNHETRTAEIIYEKRGQSTKILTSLLPGDELDMIAPLGNFFPEPASQSRPILIAGGIGMGPIFYLAEYFYKAQYNPLLILGARTRSFIPHLPLFSRIETIIATDDGSQGFLGNSVQCLENYVSANLDSKSFELYACGPHKMMETANGLAQKNGWQAWVSMEQTMGCAVGACMGCVVKLRDSSVDKNGFSYARVCTEGPVFNGSTILWEHENG